MAPYWSADINKKTAIVFDADGDAFMDDDEDRFTHWTGQYLGSGTRFLRFR